MFMNQSKYVYECSILDNLKHKLIEPVEYLHCFDVTIEKGNFIQKC